MPFVQMENISLFLDACKSPPINLQSHDIFLTVDLYESKDPAQVLQCLGAFSRAANRLQPARFPNPIGGKRGGVVSPQSTGTPTVGGGSYGNRGRGASNASNTSSAYNNNARPVSSLTPTRTGDSNSGRWSPTKGSNGPTSPGSVSSWSQKSQEGTTSPAWNINQYGYMGGASQGNLGVSFGGRRQITSAGPHVPNAAEKEKKRKAEEERLRLEAEEAERRRLEEQAAEEERARLEEEQRWAEETRKLREQETLKAEEEKRKWEEEERRWKMEEERRQKEEREAEAKFQSERTRTRGNSDARLRGQFLSQYQAENGNGDHSESSRVKELERELELARERERQYERERQAKLSQRSHQVVEDHDLTFRMKEETSKARSRSRSRPRVPFRKDSDERWREDERDYLRQQWSASHQSDGPSEAPSKPPRPLPEPAPARVQKNHTGSRPLPDPAKYATPPTQSPAQDFSGSTNRTDRYLSSNPAPQKAQPKTTYSNEIGGFDSAAERDAEDRRRVQSQQKTKAGGWASKSLLEREMEMERQRQQEWEESQKEVKTKVASGDGVDGIGGGIGGKWDVNQWTGYTGGDSQNRGTQGIGSGRRQIVGPRPPPPGR